MLANNMLYKLKFNSYNLNGVTLTTVLIFVAQSTCMVFWKFESLKWNWIIGVVSIIFGVYLIEKDKT
jgi:uncharacterized protein (DUF486 family)